MDLFTLHDWVYPETADGVPPYVPGDAVGRYNNQYASVSPTQDQVYRPNCLVENYDSLIWKESFREGGGFELKTYNIQETLDLLPAYTLVSLRETDEVCIVTVNHIENDADGKEVLTVKGVSYAPYLLANRPTWAYQGGPPNKKNATHMNLVFQIPDHLAFQLWGSIVFPFAEGGFPLTGKAFELPMNVIVPHTAVTQTIHTGKGFWYRTEWPHPIESRWSTVSQILELDQRFGIRTIRPKNSTAKVYRPNFDSIAGEGFTEIEDDITRLRFDVYETRDLSKGEDRVMFSHRSGDILSSEWIQSIEVYKNVVSSHSDVPGKFIGSVNAFPAVVSRIVWENDGKVDESTGEPLVGDPESRKYLAGKRFQFGENDADLQISEAIEEWPEEAEARLRSRGIKYLREQDELLMMNADISALTQYKYKEHYDLGDVVLVHAKYGEPQKMVVSDYTMTSDASGTSGYPTLTKWVDPDEGVDV